MAAGDTAGDTAAAAAKKLRFEELMQLIVLGRNTEADNIEVEQLGAEIELQTA